MMCEKYECLLEEDARRAKAASKPEYKKGHCKCPICERLLYQLQTNLYFLYCKNCVRLFLIQPRPQSEEQALRSLIKKGIKTILKKIVKVK